MDPVAGSKACGLLATGFFYKLLVTTNDNAQEIENNYVFLNKNLILNE